MFSPSDPVPPTEDSSREKMKWVFVIAFVILIIAALVAVISAAAAAVVL